VTGRLLEQDLVVGLELRLFDVVLEPERELAALTKPSSVYNATVATSQKRQSRRSRRPMRRGVVSLETCVIEIKRRRARELF
jgi:hypothetical protein